MAPSGKYGKPDPSALLRRVEADERRDKRGKLKIFFGSSAGVGKTYAMLQAAERRRKEGVDVLVGVVETHGRLETEGLLGDLPILPRRDIDYRGVRVQEFDLDVALARKPALILMDELAHNNAPGSRHPKRWQDVEELLDAGIDVFTTLNVQHLESLNDVVESITGIGVRETVPDLLFDEADDIILVDIPPDELLKRLKEGKVYVAPGANDRAVQNFFRKTNLLSLRELALRRMADYVDAGTDDERLREGLWTQNIAGDRLMVCIGPDRLAGKLVRTTRRLATSLKTPWTAAYVEIGDEKVRDPRLRQHIQQVLQSAERNGAHLVSLHGQRVGDELLAYARANGITKIIIGKPIRSPWQEWLNPNLVNYIIRHSGNIDVYVITGSSEKFSAVPRSGLTAQRIGRDYALTLLVIGALTGLGWLVRPNFSNIDIVMFYLMGVVVVAAWLGRSPALLYSFVSVNAFNFFFVDPVFTFNVYDQSYWLTFMVMLFASFVISNQTLNLRDQAQLSRQRERKTQIFYQLTRSLASVRGRKAICDMVVKHTEETSGVPAAIWIADESGKLVLSAGKIVGDEEKETTVAQWCFGNEQPAGLGTDTLPSAAGYYLPILGTDHQFGVFAVFAFKPDETFRPDEIEKLETIASLLASSLERTLSGEAAEQSKIARERERMRNVLLSSVSHDLRTPLAAIAGAAETLAERPEVAREATALTLVQSISKEAGRLTRIVSNLLDVTRYEDGELHLNLQPYFLPEIIGNALESCRDILKDHQLETHIPSDLPLINMDGVMISQVLANLFENAAKHTPVGTKVIVEAKQSTAGVLLTVSDNGLGVPPGREETIFEKFATYQRGDLPKGAGLGLAICQAIITAHQGKIWAENRAEGGSRFCIFFPLTLVISTPAGASS